MRLAEALGERRRAQRALAHRLEHDLAVRQRLRPLGVLVHQRGEQRAVERAPVDADAHRLAVRDRHLDHAAEVVVVLRAGADVAGVDAVLVQRPRALGVLGQQQVAVVVEVAHDRHAHARGRRAAARSRRTAAAASRVLTVMRTSSEPAAASSATCAAVAAASAVSVLVMDCTTTGCAPPTGTSPTRQVTLAAAGPAARCRRSGRGACGRVGGALAPRQTRAKAGRPPERPGGHRRRRAARLSRVPPAAPARLARFPRPRGAGMRPPERKGGRPYERRPGPVVHGDPARATSPRSRPSSRRGPVLANARHETGLLHGHVGVLRAPGGDRGAAARGWPGARPLRCRGRRRRARPRTSCSSATPRWRWRGRRTASRRCTSPRSSRARAAVRLLALGADAGAVARNDTHVQPLHSAAAAGALDIARAAARARRGRERAPGAGLHRADVGGAAGQRRARRAAARARCRPGWRRSDEGRAAADFADERGHHALAARLRARSPGA